MKTSIQPSMLLLLAIILITPSLFAQTPEQEIKTFVKQFELAFNKKDAKAVAAFYTKDATRALSSGVVNEGNDAIKAAMAKTFEDNDPIMISIKHERMATASDGTAVQTGTYHVSGKVKQTGAALVIKGTFTNTLIKEKGKWKISKSVLITK